MQEGTSEVLKIELHNNYMFSRWNFRSIPGKPYSSTFHALEKFSESR